MIDGQAKRESKKQKNKRRPPRPRHGIPVALRAPSIPCLGRAALPLTKARGGQIWVSTGGHFWVVITTGTTIRIKYLCLGSGSAQKLICWPPDFYAFERFKNPSSIWLSARTDQSAFNFSHHDICLLTTGVELFFCLQGHGPKCNPSGQEKKLDGLLPTRSFLILEPVAFVADVDNTTVMGSA
jgi:hypothetical protein